jgi:hypothetical protein
VKTRTINFVSVGGLLAVVAAVLAAAPAKAQVNYAVSGNTAYVASSPNASGAIVIASTYNGYPVTTIGDYAFSGYSFHGCTNLTSVTIPDSVTQIGTGLCCGHSFAFYNCTSLTNVIIGNSVTNIGKTAFTLCTSLTRVTIPASVINIGSSAFYYCSSLTNVTFLGNPPELVWDFEAGGNHFSRVGAGAKAYYYCGTTGWGTSYGGLPTVMLCPPQFAPGSAGMKPGGFGFTLNFLTNQTIVVEASTNLLNWQPIWTNTPPDASTDFVDPDWVNKPRRFYRARSD